MDLRRFTPVAVGTALLVGCTSTPKPAAPEASRAVAPAAETSPNSNDPLPPGLTPKFVAFLTSQGLSSMPAKPGEAARLTAAWNNKVIYAPDPVHGGDPIPGFLAKLWLFGPDEAVPVTPDGEIIVGMWDNAPATNGGQPALLELWHIDRETAKKFRKSDFMGGQGYTLFLPSTKYNVDLKRVNVVARYNGADGRCLVSSPESLTIDHSSTLQRAAEKLGMTKLDGGKADVPTLPVPAPLPLPSAGGRP